MKGGAALLGLGLLLVSLLAVVLGLVDAVRGLDVGLLLPLAVGGLLAGWGLGWLPLPLWLAGPVLGLLGMEVLSWRVGRLGPPVLALLRALWQVGSAAWQSLWHWGQAWWGGEPVVLQLPSWTPVQQSGAVLSARMLTLWGRAVQWIELFVKGTPTYDPVAAALLWGLALWLSAAWAGWVYRRHNLPLLALAPAGALVATASSYVGGNAYLLLPLLGTTLLAMALSQHQAREQHWQAVGIDFSRDIRLDLTAAALAVSVVLVGLAALAPAVSLADFREWLNRRLTTSRSTERGEVAESLGLEPKPVPRAVTPLEQLSQAGLPRRHLLTGGPDLAREVVMVIRTGDLPPAPVESLPAPPPTYYWRGTVYDIYNGRGWLSSGTTRYAYEPGQPLTTTVQPYQRPLRQEVQVIGATGSIVHVAGQLVAVDQPVEVAWRGPGDLFGALTPAPHYRADSLIPVVSEAQLRAAGTTYPPELGRYLALPESVPARVLTLARDLTATGPTPYDRARALETYLRRFPYTLAVPLPPSERDVVDYFLFDLRQGYCDYYATAMVVLARAAGIPARLVVGYVGGTYEAPNARYIITQADAHAWPELYFPGYGWIEFEPTGGRPPLERAALPEPVTWPAAPPPLLLPPEPTAATPWRGWLWLRRGLVAGLLVGLAGLVGDVINLWRRPLDDLLRRLYRRLRRQAQRLAVPLQPGDTPYEFVAAVRDWLPQGVARVPWPGLLFPVAWELEQLAALYVQSCYGQTPLPPTAKATALRLWWRLRWRLALARWGQGLLRQREQPAGRPPARRPELPQQPPPT